MSEEIKFKLPGDTQKKLSIFNCSKEQLTSEKTADEWSDFIHDLYDQAVNVDPRGYSRTQKLQSEIGNSQPGWETTDDRFNELSRAAKEALDTVENIKKENEKK